MKTKCPECGGDRRSLRPSYHEIPPKDMEKPDCFTCNGTGEIEQKEQKEQSLDDEIKEAFEEHKNNYCKNYCGNTGEESCTYETRTKAQLDFCFDDNAFEEFGIIYKSAHFKQKQRISELGESIKKAFNALSLHGVPKERAGTIDNGVFVLSDRYARELIADQYKHDKQIESMKCCGNCLHLDYCEYHTSGTKDGKEINYPFDVCDNWKIKDK